MRSNRKSPLLTELRRRAAALTRVTAFATFVLAVIAVVIGSQAHAELSEQLFTVGSQMLDYTDNESPGEGPRTLALNGQRIHFQSGITRQPLARVLDAYERRCDAKDGQIGEQMRAFLESEGHVDREVLESPTATGVMRAERDGNGFVACLDLGTERLSADDLLARIDRVAATGDLSELGDMRYLYAEQGESDETTHYVVFFTEGSFSPFRMFPAEGDAPGRDVAEVPRPPGGRRVLSVHEEGEPVEMVMYSGSSRTPGQLERFYEQRFERDGFELIDTDAERRARQTPETADAQRVLFAERGDTMATVVLGTDPNGRGVATILVTR